MINNIIAALVESQQHIQRAVARIEWHESLLVQVMAELGDISLAIEHDPKQATRRIQALRLLIANAIANGFQAETTGSHP